MENIRDWEHLATAVVGPSHPGVHVHQSASLPGSGPTARDPQGRAPSAAARSSRIPTVLDTWFSSWLWPFATLGLGPDETPDLKRFYPGHTLVTAPEIPVFSGWARDDHGRLPLPCRPSVRDGCICTATVRDTQHRKMSKSLGNGNRSARRGWQVRRGRAALDDHRRRVARVGPDPRPPMTWRRRSRPGRNFREQALEHRAVSSWRSCRSGCSLSATWIRRELRRLADRWILGQGPQDDRGCHGTPRGVPPSMKLPKTCFEFAWSDLADWYVEAVKPRLAAAAVALRSSPGGRPPASGDARRCSGPCLAFCFDNRAPVATSSRAIHYRGVVAEASPADSPRTFWRSRPGLPCQRPCRSSGPDFEFARRPGRAISKIRAIRAEYRVAPKTRVAATIKPRTELIRAAFDGERDTRSYVWPSSPSCSSTAALRGNRCARRARRRERSVRCAVGRRDRRAAGVPAPVGRAHPARAAAGGTRRPSSPTSSSSRVRPPRWSPRSARRSGRGATSGKCWPTSSNRWAAP